MDNQNNANNTNDKNSTNNNQDDLENQDIKLNDLSYLSNLSNLRGLNTQNDKNDKNNESGGSIANADNADDITEVLEIKATPEMIDSQFFVPEEKKKRLSEELFEWIEIFSSALITVILLFTFIFRLVTVEGPSMEHTLHAKDNLVISHLLYTPKQNDIVVIQVPNPAFTAPIIKRVIATEGQKVDFDIENWIVYVDGVPLDEPYVNFEEGRVMANDSISLDTLPITVEKGKIFVMGDNRNHSSDSRSSLIGQVDVRNVVGRVMIRIFPLNKFGLVKPNVES